MWELLSLQYTRRRSRVLFIAFSNCRKSHKPRPEVTVESLRFVMDNGNKKSGVNIDGAQMWCIFERIFSIYDVEERSDVFRLQSLF
jgi:hypothetical protein